MKMFTLIAYAIIVLTMAVIVLAAFAVFNRHLSDLREARVQRLRRRMQRYLQDFLADQIEARAVVPELGTDTDIALSVLIDTASRLPRPARMKLRVFFDHFQFVQSEITALQSRRWALRVRAASRLGYMSHDLAVPALVLALNDEMLDVRLAAAHALAQLGAVHTVRAILGALALPAAWPLQRAAEILYEMGDELTSPLLEFLDQKDPQKPDAAMVVAVRVLGMLRASRAVPRLSGFLGSPDLELRLSSAKALGQMGDTQVVPALVAALEDPAWEVRSAAAQALGRLGGRGAIPALVKALADPAWWVRFNAAESLYQAGDEGRAGLKAAVGGHSDGFARDISRQVLEEHGAIPVQKALPT
ncbi:MAG TPA: HEAT repeat domain-containing protein [Nevskiales bacterium]|nr:HEAT repeat domain-containing protein [Nevskiales bacterium]